MLTVRLFPLLAAAAILAGQDVPLARQGEYWVRISNGSAGVPLSSRLTVSVRGPVALRGSTGEMVTFQLTERVRARSQAEARGLLREVNLPLTHNQAAMTYVAMPRASGDGVISQLDISVPRGMAEVTVETRGGGIEVYDLDGNVQAETSGGTIRGDRIRGSLSARTGGGEIRLGTIGGQVQCSNSAGSIILGRSGGATYCQTRGGEIMVTETGGPAVLWTEGGNIQVDRAASSVEAHTDGGMIEVGQAGGVVTADTHGGSIQVGLARGVKLVSGAGTIRVKTSASPLDISTAMGNILAEMLAGTRFQGASLVAGAGDITVLIPSNLSLSVIARNESIGSPRIISDFSGIPVHSVGFARPPLVAEGSINGGGPILRVSAAGGTIYLRRVSR